MKALLSIVAALTFPVFADDPPAETAPKPSADPIPAAEAAPPAPLEVTPAALLEGAEIPAPLAEEGPGAGAEPADAAKGEVPPSNPFDMTLKDGRVLKSYQIHNWNKTSLTIFHSTGAISVPAHLLPDNVVKAYNMDAKLSQEEVANSRAKQLKAAKDSQAAYEQRRALSKAPQVKIQGQVKSVHGEGFVIEVTDPQELASSGYQRVGGIIVGKDGKPVRQYAGQIFGTLWITNHPQAETLVDGDRLRFQARLVGRHQVEGKTYRAVRYEKPLP